MPALPVALVCGWLAVAGTNAAPANPPDAFLDQPLPPGYVPHSPQPPENPNVKWSPDMVSYLSYQERLDALQKLAPRKLVLPGGLAEFIAKVDRLSSWNGGFIIFRNERDGEAAGGTTYRSFMNFSFNRMGLKMTYDPSSDSLVADFPWHHEDGRSRAGLLHILKSTHPVAKQEFGANDPWRTTLDVLLSNADNFPNAWKLRYLDSCSEHFWNFAIPSGTVVWAGDLPDKKLKKHFVVLNYHENDLPLGAFFGYVFDSEGWFESGTEFLGPYRCSAIPKIELAPSGKELEVSFDDGYRKAYGTLRLEREGLILHDADTSNMSYLGIPLYRTETLSD